MGYVETNLKIPEVKALGKDILMLVIENSEYAQRVPIQLEMLHIDRVPDLVSEKEIAQLSTKWRQGKIASLPVGRWLKLELNQGKFSLLIE